MNTNSRTRVWLLLLPFLVCSSLITEASITVFTYQDLNNNGTRDDGENLVTGLTVRGFDDTGHSYTFQDNGMGTFTLDVVPSRLRVQISGYSANLQEGIAGPTSVFFAEDGDIVEVPVTSPEVFDLESTTIVVPCYEKGSAANKVSSPAIVSFPYNVDGIATQYGGDQVNPRMDATIAEVGSTWGIAYQRTRERLFASSILKRHVEMGPEGPGAIYTLDYEGGANPVIGSFNLQGYKPSIGPEIDLGVIRRDIIDGKIDETTPYALSTIESQVDRASYDIDAFDKVGKMAYGDIDLTEDENQLWMVNLRQRSLIRLDISGPNINLTAPNIQHYLIDNLSNLPDTRFRYRRSINVGGNSNDRGAEAFTDAYKKAWDRNKYSTDGQGDIRDHAIEQTMDASLGTSEAHVYQTWRKGRSFTYDIPVPKDETYEVILHFAEPYNHQIGDRKFDVLAEGQLIFDDFDIVAEAGASHRAITRKFEIEATDGNLTLEFKGQFGNKIFEAVLMGIEVVGTSLVETGVLRPWGLSFHNGRGYLGLTADASITQSRDHLMGYVISFDPNDMSAPVEQEVSFPLNYPRERASNADQAGPQVLRTAVWLPWVSDWESTYIPLDDELSFRNGLLCSYPQPLISDINFTEDGSMVIGMMDRWAHQTGYLNYSTVLGDQTFIIGYASGDILKAFKMTDGQVSADGTDYMLEMLNFDDGVFYRNDDGPSYSGEFFYRDGFRSQDIAHHGELVTGGMAILQGTQEVVTTVHNPVETSLEHFDFAGAYTQGLHFYSTENGEKMAGYLFVDQFNIGKANGLGDIEFAHSMHSGEVGNYVWCDANGNGIQDPAERGIPGIELVLHDKDNSLEIVDRVTTDANGNYTFTGLGADHCYEIRIDLSQLTDLGFSGLTSPLMSGSDSLIDSDADPDMLPGFAVAMFCMNATADNMHDIDFGFGGPLALDATKVACEDMAGCATFMLADIDDCVDTSGLNQVSYFPTFNDADSLLNQITDPSITVCDGDSILYARVASSSDPGCFSIAVVTLRVIGPSTPGQDFAVDICPAASWDALAYLQQQGYRGDITTELFSDALKTMPIANPVALTMFPTIIYYDDTTTTEDCGVMGSITIDTLPAAMVNAGDSMEICGTQCVDLTALGASFTANGSTATQAMWTSSGTGSFTENATFAGARFYCPSEADMMNGGVTLTLMVTDDPCGRTIADAVNISIIPSIPRFIEPDRSDTIDCIHPFVEEPLLNDTFPKCRLVANCVDTITATVIDYTTRIGDCEDIVKLIIRTQRVRYQKQDYFCTDTIFVRGLDFDAFTCPPERDSVYCHTGYLMDANGHPSPLETGVPMAGDVPLWPKPNKACDVLIIYKDHVFDGTCPQTIRRTWLIKNNCTGDFDSCLQWLMIYDTLGPDLSKNLDKALVADSLDFPGIDHPVIFVPTNNHDCEAHTYIPPVYASDTCSDVKMVKARIPQLATLTLDYNADTDQWESHQSVKIPRTDAPLPVIYEAYDHCHNVTYDTCYFYVKDLTKPVPICDKGVNVTLSDTTVWVAAETFDEESWDNCGISLLLARRSDWATACGVDLCDNIVPYCGTEHHDSLYCAILESDKHINPIEAHYAENLRWLCEDDDACSSIIVGGWWYDLIKYATLECVDHPYNVDEQYLQRIFSDPTLTCTDEFLSVADACFKHGFDYQYNLPAFPGPFFSESLLNDFDIVSQIGGGWSKEVPFCCADACQEVTVELLAMDYWCNWSKCWTTVMVEDKNPPEIVDDLYDISLSCTSYKQFYEEAVIQAQNGDATLLDSLLGGYDKVSYDRYDNLPEQASFTYYNVACDSILVTRDSLHYDEHFGYVWKTYSHYEAVYDTTAVTRYRGRVADDCGLICWEEAPWVNLDHCGNGSIKRTFKFIGQCLIEGNAHTIDTITRYQTIWIQSDCKITKSMFTMPEDLILHECELVYDPDGSGNAAGAAHPDYTGRPEYVFADDCKQIGIGYYDRVFKVAGGETGCYKIVRTWCFADWCYLDEYPTDPAWWLDDRYEGKYFSCEQKILLLDTIPPDCMIDLPTTIESDACSYHLDTEVQVEDACGSLSFRWELIDDKTAATVQSHAGELDGRMASTFRVQAADLVPGTYTLKVVVTDACQNESTCKHSFVIEPRKKPAPVCLSSITLDLTPMDSNSDGQIDTAMGTIWAEEFNVSSQAACGSDPDKLKYYIDRMDDGEPALPETQSLTFGCADLGAQVVRMYVEDETGTWDYCQVVLVVQDNNNACPGTTSQMGQLSGVLLTENNRVIQGADVRIMSETGEVMQQQENVSSVYEFALPVGSKAYVSPYKDTDHLNGVSTRDLIDIQQHVLGLEPLGSWFKEKAGDANADGNVSVRDILEIRRLILGKTDRFTSNTSWRFFDRGTRSESYHIDPMRSRMQVHFTGVKIGDVNLDADPTLRAPRAAQPVVWTTTEQALESGQVYRIAVRAQDASILEGFQFTLQYDQDKVEILGLSEGDDLRMSEDEYFLNVEEGWLTASWFDAKRTSKSFEEGEILFHIELRSLQNNTLSDVITLNHKRIRTEAYTADGKDQDIAFVFGQQLQEGNFQLYQNRPNPFAYETIIGFDVPKAGRARLSVHDVTGKQVHIQEAFVARGYHEWKVADRHLPTTGIYYYKLETDAYAAVRKMILMTR